MVAFAVKPPPQHAEWADMLDVWRTADDMDVDPGPDQFAPEEIFYGIESTLEVVSFGLPLGGPRSRLVISPSKVLLGPVPVGSPTSTTVHVGNAGNAAVALFAS